MNTSHLRFPSRLAPALLLAAAGTALATDHTHHAAAAAAHHAECAPAAADHHAALGGLAALRLIPVRGEETKSEHSWSDGKNDVKIVRKDGKVSVTLNGQEIMNLDDSELFQAEIAGAHQQAERAQVWARRMRDGSRGGLTPMPGQPQAYAFGGEKPKVMIGVTMETAQEANAKVPGGVDPENATVITRVVEGLPAQKSGLEEGDIVVQVNGTSSAAPDDIREAIKDKKAGDELKLRVVRAGNEKDIVIALAEYDGAKLGSPMAWGFGGGSESPTPEPMSDDDLKEMKELRGKMAKVSAELEKVGAQLANAKDDDEREKLTARMAELGEEMGELGSDMGELTGNSMHGNFFGSGPNTFDFKTLPRMRIERGNGGPSKAFIFTPDGQAPAGEEDRIKKLDERLERLEKLLEKVADEQEKHKN